MDRKLHFALRPSDDRTACGRRVDRNDYTYVLGDREHWRKMVNVTGRDVTCDVCFAEEERTRGQ